MEIHRPKIIVPVAGLILALSFWFIAHRIWPPPPKIDLRPFQELGQTLAEETAKAIHDHGRIVAVINTVHQTPSMPDGEEWLAFQNEIRNHSSISLAATEVVLPDPVDLIPDAGCSRYQFKTILEKHADADAFVFFFSLPEWGFVETILPQPIVPKILVADRSVVGTKRQYGGYFDHGILLLLIGRLGGDFAPQPGGPAAARESFKQHFQIITPQNYQAMPD